MLARDGLSVFVVEDAEDLADVVAALERVAQRQIGVEAVAVAAPLPRALEVPGFDEVGDDALSGALGDPHTLSDVAMADTRVARNAEQHMGVVGQKRPVRHSERIRNAAGNSYLLIGVS